MFKYVTAALSLTPLTAAVPTLSARDELPDFNKLLSPEELADVIASSEPGTFGILGTSINNITDPNHLFKREPGTFCKQDLAQLFCETSDASPFILDCFYMYNLLMSRQEEWDIAVAMGSRTFAWANSCCFEMTNLEYLYTAYVGGGDVAKLDERIINTCGSNGKVGGWGRIGCPIRGTPSGGVALSYSFYHC
ncbi:uncharacterized protein B0I36DRAFT_355592 [Microdochium trichocladiopsis]|uniref:Ecp2 effector protein-like domain-containing protein n=1 Tax=Microdochium trichocladiopsis TaxID=1682393 RepID=A0A9P8XV51_9PEZI|nr:uncharacterized protein B0I36DRAFT_355592 [Microdochium trichocladiopsis]KAH7014367.1 hypothetical protein B0I36DRAFT_355592 [Microdochium trichocladiopsis]